MARISKHRPAELLDLARAAIAHDPDIPVLAFRAAHQIGSAEAQAVLTAARWEAGHRHYAMLELDDLHPRYRDLVSPRAGRDRASEVDLDALPAELRADIDRALDAARAALGGTVEALRATARRLIAEVQAEAAAHVRASEANARDTTAGFDALERQAAEAREEAAGVRERLGADVLRLSQEVADERRARAATEQALQRADEERQRAADALTQERTAARNTTTDLTVKLADAQRAAGAAELQARTMEDALADTRRRLTDATDAASRAQRDAAAAEARAALLESTHAAELLRLREAHAAELERLESRLSSAARRGRRSGTV